MLPSKKILKKIKAHIEKMGTPIQKIGEIIGSKAKTRQSQFSAGKNFLAGKPRTFTYDRILKVSEFYEIDFFADDHSQHVKGDGNIIVQNGGSGRVIVSGSDKKIIEQILKANESDKNLIKQLLSKFTKKS